MRKHLKVIMLGFVILVWGVCSSTSGRVYGAISTATTQEIDRVNEKGPYLGIIVPNSFEMNPLLQSPSFVADLEVPYLDYFGKRFRFGKVENERVIIVMTGLSMLNAGITTQLLLILFKVKGVLHYGIAGNANPQLQIGDVTIPQYWAHTGLWNWQRYGDGPNEELALESNGDYTREIGYLRFDNYQNASENGKPIDNFLNNVWYQPEEVFPADGIPEVRQHSFWVPVNKHYFKVAKKIEGMTFQGCVNFLSLSMKRPLDTDPGNQNKIDIKMKKKRYQEDENKEEIESAGNTGSGFRNLDENLLFEVLKHVDARTLGSAACVSKQWHRTVQDERLWELICTRHWGNMGCGNQQLRSVVLALGGFRRLHSQYLWPLSKPQSNSAGSASTSSSAWNPFSPMIGNKPPARWGKDEVHLSLSLLSIRYYEKMNFSNRGR